MSRRGGGVRSSLDRFVAALANVGVRFTSRGDHVQSECPVHSDSHPSLSGDYQPHDGQVLFNCLAGCDREDVLVALDLTWPMLYDDYEEPEAFAERRAQERAEEARTGRARSRREKPAVVSRPRPVVPRGRLPGRLAEARPRVLGEWVVTTTYDYTDVQGTVLHQEVRHQRPIEVVDPVTGERITSIEKRFTQRWPDQRGGWLEKTPKGFVPMLYRLPDLAEWIDRGRRIWLCEGAKDADRFLDLGEAATTNPSGATNFKAEQADTLTGAHVVAVLDQDLAGYRRARRLSGLLEGKAASLRFVLPRLPALHCDASDHLDAGFTLSDFVDVDADRLALLEHVADAESAAAAAAVTPAEAGARHERAAQAASATAAADEERFAARWAAEAGKQLVRATTALEAAVQRGPVAEDLQQRLVAAVTGCQAAVRAAHEAAQVVVPEELGEYLEAPSTSAGQLGGRTALLEEGAAGEGGTLVEHPTAGRLPEPSGMIPMSRGSWAYELGGDGRRSRGVYQFIEGRWTRVAPLPYLHSRIVSRDGYGRPTGTYYLVSAEVDSIKVTIGHDELVKHTWANILGLAVSHDDKILKAATTALIFAAHAETDLVEATPRVTDEGRIALSVAETLPDGYLATSGLDRDAALTVWAQLVHTAAQSPRLALVLGASAFGPFLAPLDRQPHIVSLHGDMAQGKSVAMRTAAALWGHPGSKAQAGVCGSWNQSKLAPTSFLGELGVLPAYFDEIGMAGNLSADDWGKRIFDICEGASRGRPAANGRPGFVRGRSWYGILFSAGNSRLMDGLGAGDMAGIQRRVIELPTPFTTDEAHSDALEGLYGQAYGHLGHAILDRHSTTTVRPYLELAAELLGDVDHDSPVANEILKHLHSHVAGAAIVDDLCGTGRTLTTAAAAAALEYLEEWEAPLHDADRILDAVHDSLFQEPACWPTVAQHLENTSTPGFGADTEIARHGVALKTKGLAANDQEWLAVFPGVWTELCKELGVDSDVACRELARRGVLQQQQSGQRTGNRNHTSTIKIGKKVKRFYKLSYPMLEDPDEEPGQPHIDVDPEPAADPGGTSPAVEVGQQLELAPTVATTVAGAATEPPVTASHDPVTAEVTAPVTAATPPLTCEVTAVTAVTAPLSHVGARARGSFPGDPQITRLEPDAPRPACVVCGAPAGQLVDGRPLHLGPCAERGDGDHAETAVPTAPASAESATGAPARPMPAQQGGEPETGRQEPSPRRIQGPRGARFTAPAACLNHDGLHLADGAVRPWLEISHLGELALLTGRDQLRLGWGGGEDRLPDPGQIWLYPAALERLGLPTEMPLPEEFMTKADRARHLEKLFGKLDDHPLVAGAREAGWQFGQGGHLSTWTRIWHPELLPGGAFLVGLPWHHIDGVPLYDDDPSPATLARRLHTFAVRVGIAFRLTPTATGLDLIDHHRPPRRDVDDDRGAGRRRVALVRGVGAELPPWCHKPSDARFNTLEQDFSWWRPWDKLPASEQGRRYVHGYDRNASYLVPWQGIELGVEDLQHHTAEAAAWDGRERPGYYLVDKWEWPAWGLPDPATAAGAPVSKGRVWVSVHTLRQLAAHGITPTVHEAYTWGATSRYLEGPGKALSEARTTLSTGAAGDPDAQAVLGTVKLLYAATVGKLAEREHRTDFHLWRPDWRDHVIAATRTAILHTLTKAAELSGAHPLVVDRDAIFYASDDPDPTSAWPGDPTKLGTGLGAWKPIGTGDLTTWGPVHLTKRTGRWRYSDALADLTLSK